MMRVVLLLISAILYFLALWATNTSNTPAARFRLRGRIALLVVWFVVSFWVSWKFLQLPQTVDPRTHPIDSLISAASLRHNAWLEQASASKTLSDAVTEYRRRYGKHPPPGFDEWYHYATERSSVVIDDFDNLMEDLRPFWAVRPAEIRKRTRDAFVDPWNEVAQLSIRAGKAEIGPDVKPTHRWMLDGVIAMMTNYVEKIPDMDLGFNINDEPRIIIPYSDLQHIYMASAPTEPLKTTVVNDFSKDRSAGWNFSDPGDVNNLTPSTKPFEDHSFTNTFHTYGSIACPPSSPARRSHSWDTRALCISCLAPHSDPSGLFLSNWTLSASPCHQPDLVHLHGFYLSPAAFKPSKMLYPIFSQSKADGYADIRYPSPWNYIDKAVYAPSDNASDPSYDSPFADKKETLFWRGATSEGLSRYGEWRGMARQRFVHLTNNASANTEIPIYLPSLPPSTHPSSQQTQSYKTHLIPSSLLPSLISRIITNADPESNTTALVPLTNLAIVSKIDRCWDSDCPTQAQEFGLGNPTPFQEHWQHKYLLDLDGAGFSGRFIPFLQSRSLPFKVA
ncbi:MAG: hypothetical protein Q9218_007050, partial [Villophora microphyllina]